MAFIASMAGAFVLSAGFIILQQLCMNHATNAFVDSTCLTDSHTRVLVSVYLTASAYLLIKVVFAAVNAYRVAQLQRGIEEGVYIAMTPTAPYKFQARAMATRWWPAIAVVLALQHAPGLLQPLANLGLTTVSVYVRNNSTASIDPGVGSYNASTFTTAFAADVAGDIPVAEIQESLEAGLGYLAAFSVLTQLRGFAGGQGSKRSADGSITTPIVRSNLVISTAIEDLDASNAFRDTGLVATLTGKCADTLVVAPLIELQSSSSRSFNITEAVKLKTQIGTGNVTTVVSTDVSFSAGALHSVEFNMTYFVGACVDCMALPSSQILNGTMSACHARVDFGVQDFAFSVASGTVTPLGTAVANDIAQLDPNLAGLFAAAYAGASFDATLISTNPLYLQSLLQLPMDLPGGFFGSSNSNLLYSTLCTAVSQSLGTLWLLSVADPQNNPDADTYDVYEDVAGATGEVALYSLQLVTHVKTRTAAVLVGALLGSMLVVGVWGMVWSHLSAINIKDATETSLVDNIDDSFVAKKRTAGASNDPDLQMARAFSDDRGGMLLFCRATQDRFGKSQRIVISNDPDSGSVPEKCVDYA